MSLITLKSHLLASSRWCPFRDNLCTFPLLATCMGAFRIRGARVDWARQGGKTCPSHHKAPRLQSCPGRDSNGPFALSGELGLGQLLDTRTVYACACQHDSYFIFEFGTSFLPRELFQSLLSPLPDEGQVHPKACK